VDEREGHQQREELSEADVGFRGIAILLILFLLTAIAFLIMRDGVPGFGKSSFTDWILTIATISYVVVSYRMLMVIRAQLRATEKSNYLTLRAWLIVDGMEFDPLNRTLRDIADLRVTIRNVGNVPAVSVRSMSSTRWGPSDSGAWLGDADTVDPTMELDIGPGCFTPVVYAFTPPSDAVLTAVHTGETPLTVVARFTYTDALGSIGETTFSARYLHSEGRFVLAPGGNTVR